MGRRADPHRHRHRVPGRAVHLEREPLRRPGHRPDVPGRVPRHEELRLSRAGRDRDGRRRRAGPQAL